MRNQNKNKRRYTPYQEQRLARVAVVAGSSFGWTDGEVEKADTWAMRHRMATIYLPMLVAMPFISSIAYYFVA